MDLLNREPFDSLKSIIIYCTRQKTTEMVAQLLRTNLQSWNQNEEENEDLEGISLQPAHQRRQKGDDGGGGGGGGGGGKGGKRRKLTFSADSYHAGMSASQRRSVQNKFMSGALRIVVATVAFGMGLNKSDVRAIVHYDMPKSFESFVQEIGRAGRDGRPAYCHTFINGEVGVVIFNANRGNHNLIFLLQESDLYELRRHAYSNSVDLYAIKKLVEKLFPACRCKKHDEGGRETAQSHQTTPHLATPLRGCGGHEVAFPIEDTVLSLDVKEESLETLLCYLELQGWLEMRNHGYDTCSVKCYGGAAQLRALARKVPAVAAATARLREKGGCGHIT